MPLNICFGAFLQKPQFCKLLFLTILLQILPRTPETFPWSFAILLPNNKIRVFFRLTGGDFEQFGTFTPNAYAVRYRDDRDFGHFGHHVARFVGHYHCKVHRESQEPARKRRVLPRIH